MLTPKSYKIGYEIHHRASFCELHPNQHVEISLLKLLRFQPALINNLSVALKLKKIEMTHFTLNYSIVRYEEGAGD